jgi:hypothetical protein
MAQVLQLLLGIFTGAAGERIGGAVAKGAELVALAGVIGGAVTWLAANGEGVAVTLTWNDIAFWGAILSGQMYVITRLAHRAPPPAG